MKKLLLIAAMAVLALGANAEGYNIEKVWTLNAPSIFSVTNDVRQGFGMNGKFYIHNKADQLVYEIDENGLTGVTFEGGTNCGISRDEAGNIIVSNAGFGSTAWIQATFKVINPATGEVKVYTVPEESGLTGRCDFFGFCKGNMLENGELYLTAGTPDNSIYTDGVARVPIADGEVDIDNCYLATCNGLNTNTSTVINYYTDINGEDALLFAYRSGAPGKLLADGDNFTRTGLNLPNKGACNGVFPIVWDEKELYLYPTLPNYQDGFAVSEAGTNAEPIAVVPSSVTSNPNVIQCNWLNAETDRNGITIYQYVPGGQISVYRLTKDVEIPNVYILGEVNDQNWAPDAGMMMEYDAENDIYTATVTFDGRGENGENYFSFTTELAEDNDEGGWAYIEPFRFGAVSEGDFWVDDQLLGQALDLTYENGAAFRIMAGEYKLTVSLADMTLMIEKINPVIETPDVYILGEVNEQNWAPNAGLMMTFDEENNVYTATVNFDGRGENGENYFSFTTKLAEDNDEGGWAYIEPFRFGAVSEGDFWVDDQLLGQPLDLTDENGQAFRIMAGDYNLTVSLENMTLIINKVAPEVNPGDVNNDSFINTGDVSALITALLNNDFNSINVPNADMNGNGAPDTGDLAVLIGFLLNN